MNRKQRLFNTFAGKTVDRPAFNFYEINGYMENPDDPDPFNIFSDPSWKPLLELAKEKTDRMVWVQDVPVKNNLQAVSLYPFDVVNERTEIKNEKKHRFIEIKTPKGILTNHYVTEKDINTNWCVEHLIKGLEDLEEWTKLPDGEFCGEPDISEILRMEKELGDTGCPIIDICDPLGMVGSLMTMEDYTIFAMVEKDIFHRALEKAARYVYWLTEKLTAALPGRVWRIIGPELACEPYLPPSLFHEYVYNYDKPIVDIINKSNGFARIHCHGKLKAVLDDIVAIGCMGLDPIEPPPQGDVKLSYVRLEYGKNMVLFGNLEASDIENLHVDAFRERIKTALYEGTMGNGRGFVLMPSASPYGRKLSLTAMKNYEAIVNEIERF